MNILSASQINALDQHTIQNEPVSPEELMYRAASTLTTALIEAYPNQELFYIFCGQGNNGGDGLVIASLLRQKQFNVQLFVLKQHTVSNSFSYYRKEATEIHLIEAVTDFPDIREEAIIVDALFGTGLSRPLDGLAEQLVQHLNQAKCKKVSVDMPSGLPADAPAEGTVFEADIVYSFHSPKLTFFFPESAKYVQSWQVLDIGLPAEKAASIHTQLSVLQADDICSMYRPRRPFSHKGSFGHALCAGGSHGKYGAITLTTRAALRAGAGLVSSLVPAEALTILQTAAPEAMCLTGKHQQLLHRLPDLPKFTHLAVGPGLGTSPEAAETFEQLLEQATAPAVIDADALNLLSKHPHLLKRLPKNSLLTPHPKEFERLCGKADNHLHRLQLAQGFAAEHKVIVVLKGNYTAIVQPNQQVQFNVTGNPGLASGGSGDVLTGFIVALLAQQYPPAEAAAMAVYLHGLSADILARTMAQESMLATDIIEGYSAALKELSIIKKPL